MASQGIRDPFGTQTAPRRQDQEGDTRDGGRRTFRGGQWVETNRVHRGQKAVLNGKKVTADGNGNWIHSTYKNGEYTNTVLGRYNTEDTRYGSTPNPPANSPKPKPKNPPSSPNPPSSSLLHPDLPGPESNQVGSDPDPSTWKNPPKEEEGKEEDPAPVVEEEESAPKPPSSDTSNTEVRVNDDGVVQKGKNLGYNRTVAQVEGDWAKMGIKFQNPYSSIQLPGTTGDPNKTQPTDTDASNVASNPTDQRGQTLADGANPGDQGGETQKVTDTKPEAARDWMKPRELTGREAFRAALMNTDVDIATAMRQAEASVGVLYAGQQHYSIDPHDPSKFMEISREEARTLRGGGPKAEALRIQHMQNKPAAADATVSPQPGAAPGVDSPQAGQDADAQVADSSYMTNNTGDVSAVDSAAMGYNTQDAAVLSQGGAIETEIDGDKETPGQRFLTNWMDKKF